jgi:hypothetical protein
MWAGQQQLEALYLLTVAGRDFILRVGAAAAAVN